MNPLAVEALGSIIRFLLMGLAGYIVKAEIWTEEDAVKYVSAATLAILALGWSIYQKFRSRQKLVTALAATKPMSEQQVEDRIANPRIVNPSTTTPKDEIPQ